MSRALFDWLSASLPLVVVLVGTLLAVSKVAAPLDTTRPGGTNSLAAIEAEEFMLVRTSRIAGAQGYRLYAVRDRRCDGELYAVPLRRNGEGANLLSGTLGAREVTYWFDGRSYPAFPSLSFWTARIISAMRAGFGRHASAPQAVALAESGSCGLRHRVIAFLNRSHRVD